MGLAKHVPHDARIVKKNIGSIFPYFLEGPESRVQTLVLLRTLHMYVLNLIYIHYIYLFIVCILNILLPKVFFVVSDLQE